MGGLQVHGDNAGGKTPTRSIDRAGLVSLPATEDLCEGVGVHAGGSSLRRVAHGFAVGFLGAVGEREDCRGLNSVGDVVHLRGGLVGVEQVLLRDILEGGLVLPVEAVGADVLQVGAFSPVLVDAGILQKVGERDVVGGSVAHDRAVVGLLVVLRVGGELRLQVCHGVGHHGQAVKLHVQDLVGDGEGALDLADVVADAGDGEAGGAGIHVVSVLDRVVDILSEEVAFLVGHGDRGDGAAGVVLGVSADDRAVGDAVHGHASRRLNRDGDHAAGKTPASVDDGAFLGGGQIAGDADANLGGVAGLVVLGDGAVKLGKRSGERVSGSLASGRRALVPARNRDACGNLDGARDVGNLGVGTIRVEVARLVELLVARHVLLVHAVGAGELQLGAFLPVRGSASVGDELVELDHLLDGENVDDVVLAVLVTCIHLGRESRELVGGVGLHECGVARLILDVDSHRAIGGS